MVRLPKLGHNGGVKDADIRRWRRSLAEERAEYAIYRAVAEKKTGQEREILLGLAEAERRHEEYYLQLLGDRVGPPLRPSLRTRLLGFLARTFGSVFALALMQYSEMRATARTGHEDSPAIVADEAVHAEVVRALATRGRSAMSGTFRAAVFGINDGLVSNLALVVGVGASGIATSTVLFTGIAGLLAGALSMAAGEWVSVTSQRELLEASAPSDKSSERLPDLNVDANELSLVYQARGVEPKEADAMAQLALARLSRDSAYDALASDRADLTEVGSPWRAAGSSFCFFAVGALIPILPFLFTGGLLAIGIAAALVGAALILTGGIVGILSGMPPGPRALRQLLIGYGAAAVTYLLGLAFGTVL